MGRYLRTYSETNPGRQRNRLQRRVSAPQVETAHAAESPMAAQAILRLQRSHGNAFVQRLIQTQLPNTIQRKTATQPNQGAAAQAGATPAAAAHSPGQDARYRGVIERLEKTSRNNKAHQPPAKKVADARAASVAPANDRRSRAQANQVEVMNRQEAKKPKADDFLDMLRAEIARIAPRNMDETERFKKEGKAAKLKNTLTGRVEQRKDAATRDIENATEAAPDPNSVAPKAVTPMPPEPGDAPSPDLRPQDALPQPKPDAQVSVESNKKKADQMMADNDIDEPQLRNANEPQFSAALDAKKGLEAHVAMTPKTYRREEQSYLKTAGAQLAGEAKGATAAMLSRRSGSKGKVKSHQLEAKRREEEERKKVADRVQGIYAETRKRVEDKLSSLDKEVNDRFDRGEKAARQHFENFVDRRMAEYKLNRYLKRFGGPLLWAKDKLFGMPEEVNRFYEEGRDQYLREMDVVLVGIADAVESRLKEAKSEIAGGRKRIRDYVESLPEDLQQAGREAEKEISTRFDELAQSVEDKKRDLAQSLAKRYVEARNKLDERIKELQAENGGLVNKFVDKLKNVIQILANFKARITSLLRKSADVIRQIVKDPIGFLRNLVAAVKQGFNQFARNILKHLQSGLMGWLFGAVAGAGIQIPTGFSLKSLFGLVLQILGVTKEHIRAKLIKTIGAKNAARIEQAWNLIAALISSGPMGLWEQVKGYLGDFKEMVLSEIRNWVIFQIVKAAILWLISLFNPASALLRAIMAIYNIVTFFIERLNQIRQLVEAIVESVTKIVAGNIGAAANWIEQAMGRSVPVIIGFLANLLGLTGITQKIQSIIKKVQRPVDKAIDNVVAKIVSRVKKSPERNKQENKQEKDKRSADARLTDAIVAVQQLMSRPGKEKERVEAGLPTIVRRFGLRSLRLVKDHEGLWHAEAEINPKRNSKANPLFTKAQLRGLKNLGLEWARLIREKNQLAEYRANKLDFVANPKRVTSGRAVEVVAAPLIEEIARKAGFTVLRNIGLQFLDGDGNRLGGTMHEIDFMIIGNHRIEEVISAKTNPTQVDINEDRTSLSHFRDIPLHHQQLQEYAMRRFLGSGRWNKVFWQRAVSADVVFNERGVSERMPLSEFRARYLSKTVVEQLRIRGLTPAQPTGEHAPNITLSLGVFEIRSQLVEFIDKYL